MARQPYQYKLRLRMHREPPKVARNLPHLVFYRGRWHLFRTRRKSRFRGPLWAANISGTTITEVKQRLAKAHDRYRFGYNL